jgi:hypothetical protein
VVIETFRLSQVLLPLAGQQAGLSLTQSHGCHGIDAEEKH